MVVYACDLDYYSETRPMLLHRIVEQLHNFHLIFTLSLVDLLLLHYHIDF